MADVPNSELGSSNVLLESDIKNIRAMYNCEGGKYQSILKPYKGIQFTFKFQLCNFTSISRIHNNHNHYNYYNSWLLQNKLER